MAHVVPIIRLALALLLGALAPAILTAAPREAEPRLDPRQLSALPSYVQRVEPAIVGLQVEVPRDRPAALTLGAERWGSGVIFDAAGHVLTVSYIVLDAQRIEATLRDGRKVPAHLADGVDQVFAQLRRERRELILRERAQVGGGLDRVQESRRLLRIHGASVLERLLAA